MSYAQESKEYLEQDYAEEKIPEIHRAESRLAESVGSLVIGLDQLEKRLERVLRPEEPVDPSDDDKLMAVRPGTTQFTDFLNAQSSRVESQVVRVNDMLRRLGL